MKISRDNLSFIEIGVIFLNNFFDVWLSVVNINNNVKLKLLKNHTSQEIFYFNKKELGIFNLREGMIDKILMAHKFNLDKYFNYLEKYNISVICFKDDVYPSCLKNIDNLPAFLYVRGNLKNLYGDNVAIVGSREASEYGMFVARKIAKAICDKNVNIVSGLAIGIDKYAHLGALDSNIGKTIAVLGTGVSNNDVYPAQNQKIFERILSQGGTIVSEFKLGTKPEKYNFPLRNRIISGLSSKVIVVEAEENSGSLITVEYALEQGKDIYAVPGNVTSKKSIGTNKLIEEGAYILTKPEDIFKT